MNIPNRIAFVPSTTNIPESFSGNLCILVSPDGELEENIKQIDELSGQVISRFVKEKDFSKLKDCEVAKLGMLPNLKATSVFLCKIPLQADQEMARRAGANISKLTSSNDSFVLYGSFRNAANFAEGYALRSYEFNLYKTNTDEDPDSHTCTIMASEQDAGYTYSSLEAGVKGVYLTRDLVNEPANILNTTNFADRLLSLRTEGIDVAILEQDQLEQIGMRALLGVGQGSDSPSKVVTMHWRGNQEAAPVVLLGKGVVFDTGGISIKPANGMEQMTMDMAGAGVVAGTMKTLALQNAQANVIGIVGLVENMPSGSAQRPGDIVRSLKGDTIEVINTDAEGRLVLADLLWWAQQEYNPAAMINLATLTGAIVISLGHEYAGAFSNNDSFFQNFEAAAKAENEKVWRQPLDPAYDELLKSRLADVKNVGGREAGAITAAQFLNRFVDRKCPWIHLDIAGVASISNESDYAPKGPTGWGVRALARLVLDNFTLND